MRTCCFYISFLVLFSAFCSAQLHPQKPVKTRPLYTKLYFAAGYGNSALFPERNALERNRASGIYASLQYGINSTTRLTMDYTEYLPINIEPTWYDFKNRTFEMNWNFITRITPTMHRFYPIAGISYNRLKGYFTGKNDFYYVSKKHAANSNVRTGWLGANAGVGYEFVYKRLGLFMEYKMRIGTTETRAMRLDIIDVCYSFGAKFNIVVPSIYKLLSGTRSRYRLTTEEADDL